jgi:DNA modification methylase
MLAAVQNTVAVLDYNADQLRERIRLLDSQLAQHFGGAIALAPALNRQMVSFQANKKRPAYRWYKYKEAFSAALVEHLLAKYGVTSGVMMDPFAGSGTTLFVASSLGMDAVGIELLPIGQELMTARLCLERQFTDKDFARIHYWLDRHPWKVSEVRQSLPSLRITRGAYPPETVDAIERYIGEVGQENSRVGLVLHFALLCVLESVSFTRKDGQYLRWDGRSGRKLGNKEFNKGPILDFVEPGEIQHSLLPTENHLGRIDQYEGSVLDVLPTLSTDHYAGVVTSPPYCNRYDYTRTYALELAMLGVNETGLVDLRQRMLSCTVENRPKDLVAMRPEWETAIQAADREELLQVILLYLEQEKAAGRLNNSGIPRMVRGYFYEMACVIQECWRVLKPQAPMFMVNDNVRYAGAGVSVDLILSHIAEMLGFRIESILVLLGEKGNSSQQMGEHGREPLRKCVYVWRKQHAE